MLLERQQRILHLPASYPLHRGQTQTGGVSGKDQKQRLAAAKEEKGAG